MLGHQLGQHLVQVCDPLLIGGLVRPPLLLEGRRPVLEELLLPAIEDRGLQTKFIAELRDGLFLQQMPPQDRNLLFRRVDYLCSILDGFSRYIVNWDIRESMTEAAIEIILQGAKEKVPRHAAPNHLAQWATVHC